MSLTRYKITAPAMKHRHGWKAPQTTLHVFYNSTVGLPWADVRPLVACAFRHVQKEAFNDHGIQFIRRMDLWSTELRLNKGRCWWGRNTGALSRVFIGELFTRPRKSVYPKFKDMPEHWHADWKEGLVGLVAHELWHRWQKGHGRPAEFMCEIVEIDAIAQYRKEQKYTFTPPAEVHLEDKEMWKDPPENCVDCRQPTRYWLPDNHTPLCQDCCVKRAEAHQGKTFLQKTVPVPPVLVP